MGLKLPQPPPGGRQLVLEALNSVGAEGAATRAMFINGDAETLDLAAAHPTYFVGLRDVLSGRVLAGAAITGWRYIILRGSRPLAAAKLTVGDLLSEGGGALEFSQFNRGRYVGSTVEGVGLAERLDAVQAGDYELRLVEIPSLYVVALWLHDDAGRADILIPLRPAPSSLEEYRPYSEEEFALALREAAARKLAFVERSDPDGHVQAPEDDDDALLA